MARNWAPVTNSGLGTLINAYNAGQDRSRGIAKEKADSQRQGAEWAFTSTGDYRKPILDDNGFVTGYEDNQESFDRDQPIYKKMKPEYFRDVPAAPPPGATPPFVPMGSHSSGPSKEELDEAAGTGEFSPEGRAARNALRDKIMGRDPQSTAAGPKPLLRDPKMAQVDAQVQSSERQNNAKIQATERAQAVKLQPKPGESSRTLMAPEGATRITPAKEGVFNPRTGKTEIPIAKTGIERDEDDVIEGQAIIPGSDSQTVADPGEQIEDPNQYNPSAWLMKRIGELSTQQAPRATDQMVSVGSLPPGLLEGTGLEGFRGQLPMSMLKEVLAGKNRIDVEGVKARNKPAPDAYDGSIVGPIADDIRKGKPLGEAVEDFQQIAGRPPSKREEAILSRTYGAYEAERRANIIQGGKDKVQEGKDKLAADKRAKAIAAVEQQSKIVSEDIDRALELLKKRRNSVGPFAGQLKNVPGSAAYDMERLLTGIRSNIGFDKLQAMRESSPTGGALGAVSDRENTLLQSTLGVIDPAMNAKDFEKNLKRIKESYNRLLSIHRDGKDSPASAEAEMLGKAMEAWRQVDASGASNEQKRRSKAQIMEAYKKKTGKELKLDGQ